MEIRNSTPGDMAAILKYGFRKCGIICVEDGSERLAFDFKRQK